MGKANEYLICPTVVAPECRCYSDTLLNVFLAIAVDNLANAQELTKVGGKTNPTKKKNPKQKKHLPDVDFWNTVKTDSSFTPWTNFSVAETPGRVSFFSKLFLGLMWSYFHGYIRVIYGWKQISVLGKISTISDDTIKFWLTFFPLNKGHDCLIWFCPENYGDLLQ